VATQEQIRSIEDHLLVIETKLDGHTDRFNSIDNRLTSIENRLTLILISTLAGFAGLIAAVFFR
jgi:hypothetical protein